MNNNIAKMTIENGKNVVRANAEIFIIPNSAAKCTGFLGSYVERSEEKGITICNANNKSFDPKKDYFIETWVVSNKDIEGANLGSDNLADHRFIFKVNDNTYIGEFGDLSRYFPEKVLPTKEDETVELIYPDLEASNYDNRDDEITFDLHLNLTAKQLKYRYRNFGTWEDTMIKVISKAWYNEMLA